MEFPRRVFDGEGVQADVDFGPTLMLNRNRCILCTRCVRFMREIDTDAQIGIVDRGYGSEIATFQEEGVHSLLSGNLMDVCPVGAITTRDYRFKSRPWDNPDAVDTICTLCEKGCNTTAWIKAKPEWAKGAQLDPHDAAVQPGGQRLLDVRHRPLRLSLDRRRRAPAAPAAAHRGRRRSSRPTGGTRSRKVADRVDGGRRAVGAAVLRLRARVARGAVRSSAGSAARSACPRTASRSAGGTARSRSRRTRSSRFPPVDAPNVRGARDLGFPSARASGPADVPAEAAQRPREGALRVRSGPDGSIGDVTGSSRRASARLRRSIVQGVCTRRCRRRGHRAAGAAFVEKDATCTTHLIVQGVLLTPLAQAADIVLPGAAWVEKDASS